MRRDYYSFTVVTIVTIGSKNGDGSSIASDFRFSIWIEILRTGWWLKYWEAPQLTWACARALTPQEEVGGDLPSSTLRQVIRGHESLRWLFSFSKSAAAKNKKWNTPSDVRPPFTQLTQSHSRVSTVDCFHWLIENKSWRIIQSPWNWPIQDDRVFHRSN